MTEQQNQTDFQNTIENIDELDVPENKINPQYYLHLAILNVQNAYMNVDIKTGIIRFIIAVEQLESIITAKGVSEKYTNHIKDDLSKELDKVDDTEITQGIKKRELKTQQIKFKWMLEEIFSQTKVVRPLRH